MVDNVSFFFSSNMEQNVTQRRFQTISLTMLHYIMIKAIKPIKY